MTGKLMVKTILTVFLLILAGSADVSAQKTDCSKTTDADIVKAIYNKMETKHSGEIIHVNVVVKYGVVTLQGWATTKKVSKEIEKLAKKTNCVKKKVVNQLTLEVSGGCPPGYKRCGDTCIPSDDPCNICTARTCN